MKFAVSGVIDALHAQPVLSVGAGRAVMVIAAKADCATTELSRAVVEESGGNSVYAIDLDLRRNMLARAYAQKGALGPRIDGSLGGAELCRAIDANKRPLVTTYCFHRVGRSRIYVGALDARNLPRTARVVLSNAPHFWDAARAGGATVVVDAPSLERDQAALRIAPHMDGVVLVVDASPGAAPAAQATKAALEAAGANVMGLVYAGATKPVIAIERLRQAG